MVFFITFILWSSFTFNGESPYYHAVSVRPGDGALTLLRRYNLDDAPCNIDRFYEINELSPNESLHKGKSYKIPVLIYPYDGKSIRSSIGNNNWDKAVRIQKYNLDIQKKGLRRTDYRESKILWVPYNEIACPQAETQATKTKTPSASSVEEDKASNQVIFNLFGQGNEKVYIEDRSLKGQVYYIVAGHGGPDPGAIAEKVDNRYTLCEDEYAYDVCLRMARELLKKGATVHMIIEDKNDGIRSEAYLDCDKDETCGGKQIPLNQLKRLRQRADRINDLYAQYKRRGIKDQKVICVHVDSRGAHKRADVFFYYYGKSRTGKKLAQNLHTTFNQKYKKYQSNRGYHGTLSARPLYMLRKTDAPAVYVELANIRNAQDRKRLVVESNREALAKWLAEGMAK